MKTLFIYIACLLLTFFTAFQGYSQFSEVRVGVNGLTCSQCSRSVEMSIRKLPFVKDVQMNLEQTEGVVTFKDDSRVNIRKIAQAVFDAGFSVRFLQATFSFASGTTITPEMCFDYLGDQYQFITHKSEIKSGPTRITFLGEKYQPLKEYRKIQHELKNRCGSKAYFVTF